MLSERAQKSFGELQLGDTLVDELLLGWQFVAPIPRIVAETWIVEELSSAIIARRGQTASEIPIEKWEEGLGVVVGKITVIPGEEKLNLLYRKHGDEFYLLLSRNTRPVRSEEV